MTIVACPRCTDQVVMPAGASPRATVRCPLCQAEYPLSEVLDRLPPTLIVVGEPDEAGPAAPAPLVARLLPTAETTAAVTALVSAEPYTLADPTSTADDTEVLRLEEAPEEADGGSHAWMSPAVVPVDRPREAADAAPIAAAALRRKPPRRPQRQPGNPLLKGVKVILGGLAGLAIGQITLWWLPGKYRQDPFQFGPPVARYAPWIVPEVFRVESASTSEPLRPPARRDEIAEANGKGGSKKRPGTVGNESHLPRQKFIDDITLPGGTESARPPAAQLDADPSDRFEAAAPQPSPDRENRDPAGEPADEEPAVPANLAPGSTDNWLPAPDLPSDATPAVEPVPQESPPGPTTDNTGRPTASPIQHARSLSAADLKSVLDEARLAADRWRAAEPTDKKPLAQGYRDLTRLAEALAYTKDADDQDVAAAGELLRALASDVPKLDFVGTLGSRWMQQRDKRLNDGVILVGTVKQIERQGALFVIQLQDQTGGPPFVLVSDIDPAADFQVQARLLASGVIVSDPARQIQGYQGPAGAVVWLGPHAAVGTP